MRVTLHAALGLALAGSAPAESRVPEIDDLLRIETVTGARIAPDGRRRI